MGLGADSSSRSIGNDRNAGGRDAPFDIKGILADEVHNLTFLCSSETLKKNETQTPALGGRLSKSIETKARYLYNHKCKPFASFSPRVLPVYPV